MTTVPCLCLPLTVGAFLIYVDVSTHVTPLDLQVHQTASAYYCYAELGDVTTESSGVTPIKRPHCNGEYFYSFALMV